MDNDGQLLIISGFIMAMGLVILAIMLNSVIYMGNTAYEGSMSSHDKDILYINDLTLRESHNAYLNAHGSETAYDSYMTSYFEYLQKVSAYKGISVFIESSTYDNVNNKATTVILYSDGDIKSKYTLVAPGS
jgi:hypothetical protein